MGADLECRRLVLWATDSPESRAGACDSDHFGWQDCEPAGERALKPAWVCDFGALDPARVSVAAEEALERLQAGEAELAIHPNCGTNVAVGLLFTALSWLLAVLLPRPRARLSWAAMGVVSAALLARPLGMVVQRHVTTLPDLRGVYIRGVKQRSYFGIPVVEVQTALG